MIAKNKYGAIKVFKDGIQFDSRAEHSRYVELSLLQKAGEIKDLRHHQVITIILSGIAICKYEADFVYNRHGNLYVEDVKGVETGLFKLKYKLVKVLLPDYRFFIFKKGILKELILEKGKLKRIQLPTGNRKW